MASAAQEPNLFDLRYEDTRITFSTSSITGAPQFSYAGPRGEHSFSSNEIATLDTALGREVTVRLEAIPDLRTVTLTLVLPAIRLLDDTVNFETFAVFTTTATTIAGPPAGAAQSYELIELTGTANAVVF